MNLHYFTDTDNGLVFAEGRQGGEVEEGKVGHIHGDGRRTYSGW